MQSLAPLEGVLEEFKTLRGKMDASNPAATTPAGYLGGTASWRTDLYTGRGTLLTVRESIRLNEKLGVGHTPELKGGDATQIEEILGGQAQYAQKLIDVLREEGVDPRRVWLTRPTPSTRDAGGSAAAAADTRLENG